MPISVEKREAIITMSRIGTSGREIARKLKITHGSVQYNLKKSVQHGTVKNLTKSGRPRLIDTRRSRVLIRNSNANPKLTARQLQIESGLDLICSVDTVKRQLRRNGVFGRVSARKPFLTKKHIKKRKQWCGAKVNWTVDQWKRIIFSDESKIELNQNVRHYVRRRSGTRYQYRNINPTTKFRSSIMVWGAIRGDGTRVLIKAERNVDSVEYQRILDCGLPAIYNSRHIFQQDGAPCHRSQSTMNYLTRKSLRLLPDWPANSPDISIIENLWTILKQKIRERQPTSVNELWEVAKQEWENIPNDTIITLYESLPNRINAVLTASGASTKY